MRYMTFCSGIEALTVAWAAFGWHPVAFSEIESFPCAVLAHHYPDVPNLGDMTKIDGNQYHGTVDLIAGGTPCQDFSVAGKRAGMAGERGRLALYYLRLVDDVSPRWIVWENVPGVLSSNGGRDFALFVGTLEKLGYGWSYRVLDAQYFGVPQRRRRVFLVGYLGDWRPAAAVLFEPHCLRGHSAPCRETREDVTQALAGSLGAGGPDYNRAQGNFYVPQIVGQAMSSKWSKGTSRPARDEHHNLINAPLTTRPWADNEAQESRLIVSQYGDKAAALTCEGEDASPCADRGPTVIAFTERSRAQGRDLEYQEEQAYCLTDIGSGGNAHSRRILDGATRVRRLTPRECERLQGFPDDYTEIVYRGKPAADAPRYRALGNSMAVPVVRWIGERIAQVDE